MRSVTFAALFHFILGLVSPAFSTTPEIPCTYELGDTAYQRKPIATFHALAKIPEKNLAEEVKALSPIKLLRYAHDIAQTINEKPGEEKKLSPLAINLAKIAGAKATREDRLELLSWLLRRAETMPQTWESQFLINEVVDAAAGLDTRKVDEQVMGLGDEEVARRFGNEQTWFRFGNRDLLTPYFEFINILRKLNPQPGQRIVLLGSGVGREAIPTALRYPGVEVKGYEIVSERVKASEALRTNLGLPGVEFHEQNLAEKSFKPEPADIYYAFNPVSGATFDKILTDLKGNAEKHKRPFHIVVSGPAPYEKFTREGSGFVEVTPLERFTDDNFARYFHYNPGKGAGERSLSSLAKPENRAASLPQFPDTGEFSATDRVWIETALKEHPSNFSHVHYPTLFSWQAVDKARTTQIMGLPTLVRNNGGVDTYLEPFSGSAKEKAAAIRFALLATRPGETMPKFEYVSAEVAKELEGKGLTISAIPDRADYVYHTSTLAQLAHDERQSTEGIERKRLKEKRDQARKFQDLNRGAKYAAFTKRDTATFDRVKEFLEAWKKGRAEKLGNEGLIEVRATVAMLEHMDELGYEGRYVELDGKIVAFSLGQKNKDDTFTIYAQKADVGAGPGAAGIYPYFFREQAKELQARGVPYINLQSDEGVAGMRQMKKALGPKELVMSYEVTK